jgi:hypothetical protein
MKIHPAFDYRKGNTLNLVETTMIYQYQFERLENVKAALLIVRIRLLAETRLPQKSDLLKQQTSLKEESIILERSLKLSLQCWEILAKNKEYN